MFSARSIKTLCLEGCSCDRATPWTAVYVRPGNAVSSHPNHLWSLQTDWLSSMRFNQITPSYVLNRIFFPSQWDSFTKTQQPNKFQGLFEEINQIAGKWETNFATFYKPAHYIGSIKYLYSRKNSCIERLKFVIQNRCDKVVIELRLLQLWTEIVMILVIWNQTCAARSFDL